MYHICLCNTNKVHFKHSVNWHLCAYVILDVYLFKYISWFNLYSRDETLNTSRKSFRDSGWLGETAVIFTRYVGFFDTLCDWIPIIKWVLPLCDYKFYHCNNTGNVVCYIDQCIFFNRNILSFQISFQISYTWLFYGNRLLPWVKSSPTHRTYAVRGQGKYSRATAGLVTVVNASNSVRV